MLIHEHPELERSVFEDGLCLCVPVSMWLGEDATEVQITAYNNVWDICTEYESLFGKTEISEKGIEWLCSRIGPEMAAHGYSLDEKESRVTMEYRISESNDIIDKYAALATPVRSLRDIEDLPCLCLHDLNPDEEDEDSIGFVVICDGKICAVAGLNDFFTDDTVEIYVETAKDYRRRGFGTAVVAALTKHLTDLGYTVGYKCGEDNKPSGRIAERLGMTLSGRRYDMVCYAE